MQNSAYTKSLNMELYFNWVAKDKVFVKNRRKPLKLSKMSKN